MSRNQLYPCVLAMAACLFSSCYKSEKPRPNIQTQFERDSGFKFPTSATEANIFVSDSDFHGDYSMALTFVVPTMDIPTFESLSASAWEHPEDFKPLTGARDMFDGDSALGSNPTFIAPVGTLFLKQTGPTDVIRMIALDQATGRVFYYRATW